MSVKLLASVSFLLLVTGSPALAEVQKVAIDTQRSAIRWLGKKVAGQHNGVVLLKEGTVSIDNGKVVDGEFVFDMSSIENKDLEGKWKAKLENHLKSDDFFNISQFPQGSFDILKVSPTTEGKMEISGNLKIKSLSVPITFPATITQEDGRYKANATVSIDRTKWDIRYNSGKWYDPAALGDKLIYDDIEIELDLATVPVGIQSKG